MQLRSVPAFLARAAVLAILVLTTSIPTSPAAAQAQRVTAGIAHSDPCQFYRGRAWSRGITHYTTEMVWTCEAIARRRAASLPLGERLREAEGALERFRAAVVEAGSSEFARVRSEDQGHFVLGAHTQDEIAARTGVLSALESIRAGF
jgi:hypothetical protein